MRGCAVAFLSALLLATAPAAATTWRKVGTAKGFEGMRAEIQHIVDHDPDQKTRLNHICVVVEDNSDRDRSDIPTAYVHWREAKYIYAFSPTAFPPIDDASMSADSIDLKRDVVPTARDIRGGVNRVDRASVDRILNACARYGETFMVERHGGR